MLESTSPQHIPYTTRYMCGQSDDEVWTPAACTLDAQWLVRTFPRFFREEVSEKLQRWLKPKGEMEFLRINGPRARGHSVQVEYSTLQQLLHESQSAIQRGTHLAPPLTKTGKSSASLDCATSISLACVLHSAGRSSSKSSAAALSGAYHRRMRASFCTASRWKTSV